VTVSILDTPQRLALCVSTGGERWVTTIAEDTATPRYLIRNGEAFRMVCTAAPTQTTLTMATWWASVPNGAATSSVAPNVTRA
jgi:hypothetical protein